MLRHVTSCCVIISIFTLSPYNNLLVYSQSLQGFLKNYPFENFYSPLSLSTGISEPLLQRDSITDELLGIWRVFKLLYFGKALVGSFSFGQQSVVINRFIN